METIGYAALQVIPSLKGVQATMDSELGAMMPKAGQKAGRSFSDGFARQPKGDVPAGQIARPRQEPVNFGIVDAPLGSVFRGRSGDCR